MRRRDFQLVRGCSDHGRTDPPIHRTRGEFSAALKRLQSSQRVSDPKETLPLPGEQRAEPCERSRQEYVMFRSTPTVQLLTSTRKEEPCSRKNKTLDFVVRPLPDTVISDCTDDTLTTRASKGHSWKADRQTRTSQQAMRVVPMSVFHSLTARSHEHRRFLFSAVPAITRDGNCY
ncbi:hypothetical protein J6590_033768 [Homalodisca vitripennis]|nr:hypothetical protein J6590_033768 [Homalodisca vitripennis]